MTNRQDRTCRRKKKHLTAHAAHLYHIFYWFQNKRGFQVYACGDHFHLTSSK